MSAELGEVTSLTALRRAGEANSAVRLLAATAMEMRGGADFARSEVDSVAGILLAAETPAALGDDALTQTLGLIDQAELNDEQAARQAAKTGRHAMELLDLPAPARDAGLKALSRRRWSFGGLGIRRLPLIASGDAILELVRVEPGFGAAEHDHSADELTLVLSGAYNDGLSRYEPGEISHVGPGQLHSPRAERDGLCYLLLISFGPARFTGQFGLLQRLTGFPWQPEVEIGR